MANKEYSVLNATINHTKDLIKNHHIQEAEKLIAELESKMRRASAENRRKLSYDIIELKTDIKLAQLVIR